MQEIEVERRGHAGAIVVGRIQHGRILVRIDADQHAAGAANDIPDSGQERLRGDGLEVTQGGSRVEDDAFAGRQRLEKRPAGIEIGANGVDPEPGVLEAERRGGGAQKARRYVDGHVDLRP